MAMAMAEAEAEAALIPVGLGLEISILPAFQMAPEWAILSSCDALKRWVQASARSFSSSESAWESPVPLSEFVSFSGKKSATALAIPLPLVAANAFSLVTELVLASAISLSSR